MGALISTRNEGRARSDAIDCQIEAESRKVNMFLLGTVPESAMIVKQMKVQLGLTNDELLHYRFIIYKNSLDGAQALIRAIHSMGIEYADPLDRARADQVLGYHVPCSPSFVFSTEIAEAIHRLWQHLMSSRVMDRQKEFGLGESATYFFKEIIRIGSPGYLPTDSDILRAQQSISQVTETRLNLGALEVSITDVGKQRSPAKWMHRFEDMAYILFCASLSDYDDVLQEDNCQNRLNDSFAVFASIVRSRWFTRTSSIILLLTDVDVFEDKLSKVPMERYFPDYGGGADSNKAIEYIKWRFTQVNRPKLAIHFIQHRAVSTTIGLLSEIVKDTILNDTPEVIRRVPSCSAALQVLRLRRLFSPARSPKLRRFGIF